MDTTPDAAQQQQPAQQQPATHPCERIFGVCKSGEQCHYRNAPRGACVSFLKGKCRFGNACRESHFLLHEGKYIPALHPCLRVFNDCKFGEKCEYAQLPSTSCIKFLKGKCSFGTRCAEQHFGMFPGMQGFNMPFQMTMPVQTAAAATAAAAAAAAGVAVKRNHSGPSPSPMVLVPTGKRQQQVSGQVHPCVRVFGHCLAGATCKFATVPAEACLRHLKGSCKFGDQCAEIHFDTADGPGQKHPCARIFGVCQSSCRFADYPRECCLQFLKGKCKFGDQCRELHLRTEQTPVKQELS